MTVSPWVTRDDVRGARPNVVHYDRNLSRHPVAQAMVHKLQRLARILCHRKDIVN